MTQRWRAACSADDNDLRLPRCLVELADARHEFTTVGEIEVVDSCVDCRTDHRRLLQRKRAAGIDNNIYGECLKRGCVESSTVNHRCVAQPEPTCEPAQRSLVAVTDVWEMVRRIAIGRKEREIDPAAAALADCVKAARSDPAVGPATLERLEEMKVLSSVRAVGTSICSRCRSLG